MFDFIRFVSYLWVYYKYYIIAILVITKVISALFLRTDYDKWWTGLLPLGHYYYKRQLAGVELYFLIPSIIALLLFITNRGFVFFIMWSLLSSICNYKFAVIYLDRYNAFVYSLVPFAKYVIMLREVLKHE